MRRSRINRIKLYLVRRVGSRAYFPGSIFDIWFKMFRYSRYIFSADSRQFIRSSNSAKPRQCFSISQIYPSRFISDNRLQTFRHSMHIFSASSGRFFRQTLTDIQNFLVLFQRLFFFVRFFSSFARRACRAYLFWYVSKFSSGSFW